MSEQLDPPPLVVAIDGPAGAGKSTVASRIAERFGLLNLETGAMYRAFALKAIQSDSDLDDREELGQLAERTRIRLLPGPRGNRVFLDEVDVTKRIREADVTAGASKVSVHPGIRQWMVSMQRQLGANSGIVMEGRDIGTQVFPNAQVKIFLDAAAEVRGQRRYQQVGFNTPLAAESLLQELRERDHRDRTRAESPLKAASDAVLIDSTNLSLDEVVARVEAIITERHGNPLTALSHGLLRHGVRLATLHGMKVPQGLSIRWTRRLRRSRRRGGSKGCVRSLNLDVSVIRDQFNARTPVPHRSG